MTLDVFKLRETVVSEYRDYVKSFVQVLDQRIDNYVQKMLDEGELWPDAVLQLNPAFERDRTMGELAADGVIASETARYFGEGLRLFRHQREAIEIGLRGESYVVTTGTGSGKSLTYLAPIYDAIIRNSPETHSVRALLIYPMNALINSQLDALRAFQEENYPDSPVRFDRYTGQDRAEERERIKEDPPHILLTNYVMAEYMLLRPAERPLLATATQGLQTLVMDELHFYRGRQGADVAMLTRRLQESAGRDLQAIATSATIVTGGSRQERNEAAAGLASKFFGLNVPAANVVDETLRRVAGVPTPTDAASLRAAVEAPAPTPEADAVRQHPLTAWTEEAFGLKEEDGRLVRRPPETFDAISQRLADETSLPVGQCEEQLRAILEAGNEAKGEDGQPLLAFRLHQWFSSGSSVYATLEDAGSREFRMDGQYRADGNRLLFPLAFCRECGQEYYLVARTEREGFESLVPRSPMVGIATEDIEGEDGFFALEEEDLWNGDDTELPEHWFNERRSGLAIKAGYARFRPIQYSASPGGGLNDGSDNSVTGWYQPRPFLICLRCRAVYDSRQNDFRKLSSLSQTGRSTATTIAVNAAVSGMAEQGLPSEETKSLSFTDNRQDASLQAGHLNDFVQVALLRSGIVEALSRNHHLTFDQMGQEVFDALQLRPGDFLKEPVASGPGYDTGRRTIIDVLAYRTLEDLSRGWRITQPNLEQTGLLRIEYAGLEKLTADESLWQELPTIGDATPETRTGVIRAFLDHLRMNLAIEAESLSESSTRSLRDRASQWLRDPWRFDDGDRLRAQGIALLPGVQTTRTEGRQRGVLRLGARSNVARYLRSAHAWNLERSISPQEAEDIVIGIVAALRGHLLSTVSDSGGEVRGVRLLAASMVWTAGDGRPAPPDPIRSRSLHLKREIAGAGEANDYFVHLYKHQARQLRGMLAAEHTGQVVSETRLAREDNFRRGELSALFCSPTMELGVDIRDLDTVHLRNVPPTPANYAQRSGRAGRGGRPALIVAYAAHGNAHDQYYFGRRNEMIAGAVTPARMDLQNQELVKAHLYSTWLATTGLRLGSGMAEILDLNESDFPIQPENAEALRGSNSEMRIIEAVDRAQQIIKRTEDIREAKWFSDDWIQDTLRSAPEALDRAFDRWRELYRSTLALRDAAHRVVDDPHASRKDREEAERREAEARREIGLLLNRTNRYEESDFYPYRYLAGEGFLPGYNFPRLPVRTTVTVEQNAQIIDRPRFLGLTEFGPGNQVYHEGRKHRIREALIPPAGIEGVLTSAKLCNVCGYAHDGEDVNVELCIHCETKLDGSTSGFPQRLLPQPTMRARATDRISSEEEERVRSGYDVTTHFNFSSTSAQRAIVRSKDGEEILEAVIAPGARVWRINHGWRRSERSGFTIDRQTGRWGVRDEPDETESDPAIVGPLTGVKPYVQDFRNILLLKPLRDIMSESSQISLLHALKRAIQFAYQVEEQEIEAELIGEGEFRRLLLWEAAEGGIGVWEQLTNEPGAIAKVALQALQLCHFEEQSEDSTADKDCAAACYECLLSYSNQLEHRHLDRHSIRSYLDLLSSSTTVRQLGKRTYIEQHEWLAGLADSTLEMDFLDFLYKGHIRLPDNAQNRPASDLHVQPDFYYEREGRPGICVFLDGPHHDEPGQQLTDSKVRAELQDLGFRVITIRYDKPFAEQVQNHPDVFVPVGV